MRLALSHRLLPTLFLAVLLTGLLVAASWLLRDNLRKCLQVSAQLNYIEGYLAADAIRVATGGPLYADCSTPPYSVLNFTPLSIMASAGLIQLGLNPLSAGRLVTLLSLVALALVIAVSGFRRIGWPALAVGLLLIADPMLYPHGVAMRPDLPAVLLAAAGVALAASGRRWALVLALVLVVAAVFTKQSALAGGAAITFYLLLRQRRAGLLFGAACTVLCCACAGLLQLLSGGQFYLHTVTANINQFLWPQIPHFILRFVRQHPVEIAVVLLLFALQLKVRKLSLPALYLLLAVVLAVSSIGKQGASLQYMIEPLAAMYLFVAHETPKKILDGIGSRPWLAAVVCIAVGALAGYHVQQQIGPRRAIMGAASAHRQIAEMIAQSRGFVVSDDASLLLRAGKPVYFRPFVMTQLAEAGDWDQTPLLRDLESGRISLILARSEPIAIYHSRYTAEMREIIDRRYQLAMKLNLGAVYSVYHARPEASRN